MASVFCENKFDRRKKEGRKEERKKGRKEERKKGRKKKGRKK